MKINIDFIDKLEDFSNNKLFVKNSQISSKKVGIYLNSSNNEEYIQKKIDVFEFIKQKKLNVEKIYVNIKYEKSYKDSTLKEMLKDAVEQKIDTILFYDVNDLGNNKFANTYIINEILLKSNIRIIDVKNGIDTNDKISLLKYEQPEFFYLLNCIDNII